MPEQVLSFATNATEKKLSVHQIVAQLDAQILELETFVEDSEQLVIGDAHAKATIIIIASDDGVVQLTISYRKSSLCQ